MLQSQSLNMVSNLHHKIGFCHLDALLPLLELVVAGGPVVESPEVPVVELQDPRVVADGFREVSCPATGQTGVTPVF